MRTGRTRLICSALVVVITGAAVAIAGPIGFVGLELAGGFGLPLDLDESFGLLLQAQDRALRSWGEA